VPPCPPSFYLGLWLLTAMLVLSVWAFCSLICISSCLSWPLDADMPPFCLPGPLDSCLPQCLSATVSVWVSGYDIFLSVWVFGYLSIYCPSPSLSGSLACSSASQPDCLSGAGCLPASLPPCRLLLLPVWISGCLPCSFSACMSFYNRSLAACMPTCMSLWISDSLLSCLFHCLFLIVCLPACRPTFLSRRFSVLQT
jgi:hypothetical protein